MIARLLMIDKSSAQFCVFPFPLCEMTSLTCLCEEGSLYQRAVGLLIVVEELKAGLHAEGVSTTSVYTTTHWVDKVVCELGKGRGGEGREGRGGEGRGGEGRGGEGRGGEGRGGEGRGGEGEGKGRGGDGERKEGKRE